MQINSGKKQHEAAQNGQLFSFDNLVHMIETWAVVQRNKGASCKTASVAAVATTEKEAPSSYEDALINGKQKVQSTDRCNVCSGMPSNGELSSVVRVGSGRESSEDHVSSSLLPLPRA